MPRYRRNAGNYTCPWCKKEPPLFGIPAGWEAGVPVLCSLCGRWSIRPASETLPLMRANAEERQRIRQLETAQALRADWRQNHLASKGRGGESA